MATKTWLIERVTFKRNQWYSPGVISCCTRDWITAKKSSWWKWGKSKWGGIAKSTTWIINERENVGFVNWRADNQFSSRDNQIQRWSNWKNDQGAQITDQSYECTT